MARFHIDGAEDNPVSTAPDPDQVANDVVVTFDGYMGIGKINPQASFDVAGTLLATRPDGVLVPRFTVAELSTKDGAYLAGQNGTLVFVTSGTGSSGKTSDITGPGFYYYDSPTSKWRSIGGTGVGGPEVDGVIGNEVLNATTDRGLVRAGSGTAGDPYTLGLMTGTAVGETLQWDGTKWITTSPGAVAEEDGVIGNEVVGPYNNMSVPNPLALEGSGTAGDPYTLDVKPAGIQASHLAQMGATTGQVLQWNGTAWVPTTPSASGTFNVTPEITGSYTVAPTDDFIRLNVSLPSQTLTLPTSGIPVGKVVYVSQIGSRNVEILPHVRNNSFLNINAGSSAILIYLGGTGEGSWDSVTGY